MIKTIWNIKGLVLAVLWFIPILMIHSMIVEFFSIEYPLSTIIGIVIGAAYGANVQKIFKIYRFE